MDKGKGQLKLRPWPRLGQNQIAFPSFERDYDNVSLQIHAIALLASHN